MLTHRRFVSATALAVALVAFAAPSFSHAAILPRSLAPAASTDLTSFDTPGVNPILTMPSGFVLQVVAGASGAPAGFSIDFMKRSDFDALGGWPDDIFGSTAVYTKYYGVPTLYTVQTTDFTLDADGTAHIKLGDTFDETGLGTTSFSELLPATDYVLRIRADGSGTTNPSPNSTTMVFTTLASNNCTFTQGYWKNHPSAWPVSSIMLGTVTYTAAQMLQIFNTPAAGNGLISLAHELMAAKLSIAQGANPIPVASAIASADALIGSLVVPPIGSGFLSPSVTSPITNTLNQYNNGLLGVDHCGTVPNLPTTWGAVKVHYR